MVAVTIWRLGTSVELRTYDCIIGRFTVGKIVLDMCDAISSHLLPQYVCSTKWRTASCSWWLISSMGFSTNSWSIWWVSHTHNYTTGKCITQKRYYSVILQAVVLADLCGLFMYVNIVVARKGTWCMCVCELNIFRRANNGYFFLMWSQDMGVNVSFLILSLPSLTMADETLFGKLQYYTCTCNVLSLPHFCSYFTGWRWGCIFRLP